MAKFCAYMKLLPTRSPLVSPSPLAGSAAMSGADAERRRLLSLRLVGVAVQVDFYFDKEFSIENPVSMFTRSVFRFGAPREGYQRENQVGSCCVCVWRVRIGSDCRRERDAMCERSLELCVTARALVCVTRGGWRDLARALARTRGTRRLRSR
eukprot:2612293-Rhodomonas_salina.4